MESLWVGKRMYWSEECFAPTDDTDHDQAGDLTSYGGMFGREEILG